MSGYPLPENVQVTVCGTPFNLNKDLLAEKSSTLYTLFKENPDEDLSHLLSDIPTTPQIFKLLAKFFYGFKVNFTPENIIPVSCLASYLCMTDTHSPNNLLNQALSFFEREIITGRNESLRSLKVVENTIVFQQAQKLGLIDVCVGSIINKAHDNPLLLGESIKNPVLDDEDDDDQVFDGNVLEWKPEDLSLTTFQR